MNIDALIVDVETDCCVASRLVQRYTLILCIIKKYTVVGLHIDASFQVWIGARHKWMMMQIMVNISAAKCSFNVSTCSINYSLDLSPI